MQGAPPSRDYLDDLEVVSPELVLVSPELAAVTWRREARQPPPPVRPPPALARRPPAPPTPARPALPPGRLLVIYAAIAVSGLVAGLIAFAGSRHGTVLPPVTSAATGAPAVGDITSLQASSTGRVVHLRWQPPPGAELVLVVRTPGRSGRRSTVIYRGTGRAVTDRSVSLGTTYRYVVYGVRGGRRSPGTLAVVRP